MTLRLDQSGQAEGEVDALLGTVAYGGFVIAKKLGEGGMGAVYVAEDQELGKKVAIKVLHPTFSNHGEALARFLGEAKAASQIQHANIVEFEAKGVLADGRAFLAMEFLDGATLDAHLASWKVLAPSHALAILVQVGWALGAAHHKGIVHRDLKPENIFLTDRPGVKMFVKVLDFGIAKFSDPSLVGGFKTKAGMLLGTPAYMSPEQARGSLDVDFRTDIYALGMIAHQMVTGSMPEPDPVTNTWRDPRTFRPDLPEGWARAILWALSLHPDARPSLMRAWILALIAATDDGREVANEYARGFLAEAEPHEATRRQIDESPSPIPTPWTAPPQTTTFGHANGQVSVSDASSGRATRVALASALVVGILATVAVLVEDRGESNPSENPRAPAYTTSGALVNTQHAVVDSNAKEDRNARAFTAAPDAMLAPNAPLVDASPPSPTRGRTQLVHPHPAPRTDGHTLPQGPNEIVE